MKILLVGSEQHMSIERYYKKYLLEAGADILHFPAPDMAFSHYSRSIINKILFKTGIRTGYRPINRQLLQTAATYRPDIIFVFKGMELYPGTLQRLRTNFKLANYNPDHPYIIAGPGSGNKYVTDSVPRYHLHFCYHSGLMQRIETEFNIPTVFLPFGFEMTEAEYEAAAKEPEVNRICFLGNPGPERVEAALHLAAQDLPVDLYGHGWNKTALAGKANITLYDAVYGGDFWKVMRRYRVQLNVFRIHNVGSHNMRTFEMPAVGGIALAPYSDEQATFFKDGEECFYYRNPDEMAATARRLLALTGEEATRIRNQARSRSLSSDYSYRHRAQTVFETFQKMMTW